MSGDTLQAADNGRQETVMKAILIVILAFTLLFGCTLFDPENQHDADKFVDEFMSTYQLNKIVEPASTASIKAAVPAWDADGPTTFTSDSMENYPEIGQVTSWTATPTAVTDVYRIEATTVYDLDENIESTEEFYYVKDVEPLGEWGAEDPYVDATGALDSKKRQRFRTYFADGTTRREQIKSDATDGANYQYAYFSIDGGSLDYDTVEIPLEAFTPGEDSRWSSLVEYSHNMKNNQYWNWWGVVSRASLQGERYYSQKMVDGVVYQSYIYKEIGSAKNVVWDEGVEVAQGITLEDEKSALFTGVMRIEIIGDQKTIKAQYTINAKSGTYIVDVDNDDIRVH